MVSTSGPRTPTVRCFAKLWWCGGGDVVVVMWSCFCGGVFCGGVFVAVVWCFCGCVFVVVRLRSLITKMFCPWYHDPFGNIRPKRCAC